MKKGNAFKYSGFPILLLICIIILTIVFIINTSAKYTSNIDGNSNASIAKWNVIAAPVTANNTIDVVVGNSAVDYSIRVTNNSQVSCNYTITISNVPNGLRISLDGGTEQLPVNNVVTFANAGSFIVGSATQERIHQLSFSADLNTNSFNDDIDIDVTFTQIN